MNGARLLIHVTDELDHAYPVVTDAAFDTILDELGVPQAALERKTPLTRKTPLAPGKALQGRRPLEVRKRLNRPQTSPDSQTGTGGRPAPAHTGPSVATRALVVGRDDLLCVRCGGALDAWFGYSLQHRVARGTGGRHGAIADYLNSAVNLITLCGSGTTGCHGWVENHPATAASAGWSVPSWADPATWPALYGDDWVLLEAAGRRLVLEWDEDWMESGDARDYPGVRRLEAA